MDNLTFSTITVQSFVQGYHVYKDETTRVPDVGEQRVLKREPQNKQDQNAVAVIRPLFSQEEKTGQTQDHPNTVSKEDEIVGHIPLHMSQYVTKFLKRSTNKGTAVITGKRVNRGSWLRVGNSM